ncbi:GTP-binding protein [Schaalia meyeri]|uniref:GTPase Era n=1 Tax=Schaalia meyeri TaxID=52773 RepID=UPI0006806838|nr:GTPase Era [Schaalia meyeri]AKU65169.1 GTP-binding protein [Schaalia meyeri]OFQ21586.1 GTPase Era [Actinomyces sp. HMSC062G12]
MRFPSDHELMAGPNALDDARIEVAPDAADPEADARAQIVRGVGDVNRDGAGDELGDDSEDGSDADFGDTEAGDDIGDCDAEDGLAGEEDADLGAFEAMTSVASLRRDAVATIDIPDFPEDFRAGFISVVGRPNVGKSTLTNALVGRKIAITSGRPETTRHNIRGIVHGEGYQLVLVDTPGYHRPRTLLGKRLNDMVREALSEVDVVLFCLPANQRIGPGDQFIARELRAVKRPIVAVATKCDAVPRERVMKHLLSIEALGNWAAIVPVSSVEGKGIDHLRDVLAQTVPLSPPLYPKGDVTDESRDTLIAEFIREAALEGVRDELPHSLAVQVEEIIERPRREGDERAPMLDIHVNVYVERDSQKAIIIGRKGSRLKQIGTRSRAHIEELLGRRVYLDLHVRTAKDWQSDPKMLGRLGF